MINEKLEVAKEKKKMYCFIKDFFNPSKTHAGKLTRVRNNFLRLVIYCYISLGKDHENHREMLE